MKKTQPSNKKEIFVLFLTIFLNLCGFAIILPLSPALLSYYLPMQEASGGFLGKFVAACQHFAASIGHDDATFITSVFFGCLLASMYAFLQFLFAPIWGRISDRYGRKNILICTLFGTALSYLIWIFASSFELFIFSRILAGIMAGNLSVATAAIADVTSEENRTKGMALVGVAFSLGFLLGPAMGGILTQVNLMDYVSTGTVLSLTPFSTPALVAFVLGVINLAWVFLKLKETFPVEKRAIASKREIPFNFFQEQPKNIRNTNFAYFIFLLAFSGLEFTLSFLAAERFNYTPVNIGYLFFYIGAILIITQGYLIRRLSPIVQERALAITGTIAGIISFSLIAFAFNEPLFFIGSGFLAFAIGFSSPSLTSLVSLFATAKTQGRFLGLFRSAGSLARAFGPLVAAIPYFYFGAKMAYICVSFLLIIPLFIIYKLPNPRKTKVSSVSEADTLQSEEVPNV